MGRAKSFEFWVLSFELAGKADWEVLCHWDVLSFEFGLPSQTYYSELKIQTSAKPLTRLAELLCRSPVLLLLRGLLPHGAAEDVGQRGIEGGACQLLDLL